MDISLGCGLSEIRKTVLCHCVYLCDTRVGDGVDPQGSVSKIYFGFYVVMSCHKFLMNSTQQNHIFSLLLNVYR